MKQYEIEITRKYIVFVDAETEDEAIEQAETNYAEMTHGIADDMWTDILSVDGTPYETKEDYWLVSRWCDEDIANALYAKLSVSNRAEAVDIAHRKHLLKV